MFSQIKKFLVKRALMARTKRDAREEIAQLELEEEMEAVREREA